MRSLHEMHGLMDHHLRRREGAQQAYDMIGTPIRVPEHLKRAQPAVRHGQHGATSLPPPPLPEPASELRSKLKIQKLQDDKQRLPVMEGAEWVGRHPFRAIFSGESGTGKTTLLIHLLNSFYARYFDRIVLFSRSFHVDSTWKNLKMKPYAVRTTFDEEYVAQLLSEQEHVVKTKGVLASPKYLIVEDDMINEDDARGSKTVEELCTIGRHRNTSVIVCTQKFNRVNLTIRTNANLLCVFRASNGQEREVIVKELSSQFVTRPFFERLFNEAVTRHEHGFLTVNRQTRDPRNIYRFDLEDLFPIRLSLEDQTDLLSLAADLRHARQAAGDDSQMPLQELIEHWEKSHGAQSTEHEPPVARRRKRTRRQ